MSAFFYGIALQWKLDLRNKHILLIYYIVPLVFFAFMGGIFTSINPEAKGTLIQSMTVFGVTMGAIIGAPIPLTEFYGSDVKKAYKVGNIPLWVYTANNFISAFIHLFMMSVIIYFAANIIFKSALPTNVPQYFFSLALYIASSLGVATVIGLFAKQTSKLTLISQFIFLPSIMLSGIMFPVNMLPSFLEKISKIFPATWGFEAMAQGNSIFTPSIILISILILALIVSSIKIKSISVE